MTDTATPQTRPAIERAGDSLILTDRDGDRLDVDQPTHLGGDALQVTVTSAGFTPLSAYVDRDQALALFHMLGDWIMATAPDKPEDPREDPADDARDYAWPPMRAAHVGDSLPDAGEATVLDEAKAAVYGDRQDDYGHPREDFTRTAVLWTGLLHHLLADGAHITPEDIARCMIAVKLARDVHAPKRDNRVDIAGYALTLDRLETGK